MIKTLYIVGLFLVMILLWLEPLLHFRSNWSVQMKPNVKAIIFLLYLGIGLVFDLL